MKVTKKIKLIKVIAGKTYPITVNLESGTIKIDVSQHNGSNEQLTAIVQSIADDFNGQFTVEKHVHKHHVHTHDDNLEHHKH